MPKSAEKGKAKGDGVINPQNYNFNEFYTENLMLSKRYKSTDVDRRTWLHVPSGTLWSTSSGTHQVVEILKFKRRLLLRCIYHFKSDLINNMDHMRISGTRVIYLSLIIRSF